MGGAGLKNAWAWPPKPTLFFLGHLVFAAFLATRCCRGEEMVLIAPSSNAFETRPSFHLSGKTADVIARAGDSVDLTCRTNSAWHLCSWRLPGDGDSWCDRLSTARYAQSCHGDDRIRFQRALPTAATGIDFSSNDCSVSVVGLRGSDSGEWRCMVKESVRSEEAWTESVSVTVASPFGLELMPMDEGEREFDRKPRVRMQRPKNESDSEIVCRATGEGAVLPDLKWTVAGKPVLTNVTRIWQEVHSDGRTVVYSSLPLWDGRSALSDGDALRCVSRQNFPNGTVIFESSVATSVEVTDEPVDEADQHGTSDSSVAGLVITIIIVVLVIIAIVVLCYAMKTKKWCYAKQEYSRPSSPSDEEQGARVEPRAAAAATHEGAVSSTADEEETAGLMSGAAGATAAAATETTPSDNSTVSVRTQETDDRNGGSNSNNAEHRPENITIPDALPPQSTRSPVPPPSAPPMEDLSMSHNSPYRFVHTQMSAPAFTTAAPASPANDEAEEDLPRDRLRELIAARRVTNPDQRNSQPLQEEGEGEEEPHTPTRSSRPLSFPNFMSTPIGAALSGASKTPSSKGLSEGLTARRPPNVRRSNEYVKIKPKSMEVITVEGPPATPAVAARNSANVGGDNVGIYSSLDSLGRGEEDAGASSSAAEIAAPTSISAPVDVHFADEDAEDADDDAGIQMTNGRPRPNETAL